MADNSIGAKVGVPVVVPVIGPWTAFTPSYNGLAVTAATGMYRRIGDSMEVVTQADPNGAASGTITVTVPLGLSINTAQLTGTGATLGNLGTAQARPLNGASATYYAGIVQYASANSVAILGIGTVKSTDTASGLWNATIPDTWAASGDSISLHFTVPILEWAGSASVAYGAGRVTSVKDGLSQATATLGMMRYYTSNGYGSTNTCIRRFSTLISNTSDVVYADSATLGTSFTITTAGVYAISYSDQLNAAGNFGVSKNSSQGTTGIAAITVADRLISAATPSINLSNSVSWTGYLAAGDVIRPHSDTTASGSAPAQATFTIQRLA